MNKKIIAILLVFTLVITCFVACQKKQLKTTTINGKEYALVTDEDGNTMLNDENQFAILVTDENGEVQTNSDGEDQTQWVKITGDVAFEDYLMGSNYKIAVLEGWTASPEAKIYKNDTDNKCYVQYAKVAEIDKNTSLKTYLQKIDEQNAQLIPGFEAKGFTLTVDKSTTTVSNKNINCELYVYKIVDGDGKVVHYAENGYFMYGTMIYKIAYVCEDGIGYEDNFNFANYARENFTFTD